MGHNVRTMAKTLPFSKGEDEMEDVIEGILSPANPVLQISATPTCALEALFGPQRFTIKRLLVKVVVRLL